MHHPTWKKHLQKWRSIYMSTNPTGEKLVGNLLTVFMTCLITGQHLVFNIQASSSLGITDDESIDQAVEEEDLAVECWL
jgi:hypothetical protein